MKKIVVTIMVLSMIFAAMAAMAQGEKSFTITPRIAVNFATQKDSLDNKQGNQYGILADLYWSSLPVGFEVGFMTSKTKNYTTIPEAIENPDGSYSDAKGDFKVRTNDLPILVTYDYNFSDNFYASVGAGIAIKKTKLSFDGENADWTVEKIFESENQTKTHFAWQAGFGCYFGSNWTAELFYYDQGKTRFNKNAGKGNSYYDYKGSFVQLNVGYSF